MTGMQKTQTSVKNRLVEEIVAYADKHGLSMEDLAKKMDILPMYLVALIRGDRRIDSMEIRMYRKIASALEISCFSTMLLAGALTADDLIVREVDVVLSEERLAEWKKRNGHP